MLNFFAHFANIKMYNRGHKKNSCFNRWKYNTIENTNILEQHQTLGPEKIDIFQQSNLLFNTINKAIKLLFMFISYIYFLQKFW